jgi:nitrogen fixation/metabolism regulation signal transduction histidine kinase
MSKKIKWRLFLKTTVLFIVLGIVAYTLLTGSYVLALLSSIASFYLLNAFYRYQVKIHQEFEDFLESIRYRDFTRHFNVKDASSELQALRKGFNDINELYKSIAKEKETQYQYLQKILELVDTGILSYEEGKGEVMWMNESLKKMLSIPYLTTIHSLSSRNQNLYTDIIQLKPGEPKVAMIEAGKETYKIQLSVTTFQTADKKFNFIAFQNINKALDETETKAWQQLLGVLTHEIMNSIAPITSLADTIKTRLTAIENATDYAASKDDLKIGMETIKRRSEGLLKFAETYRNLTKISKPILKKIYARDLFEHVYQLMQQALEQKNIELDIILKDPGLMLKLDVNLIEQVLINLILNAMEAVKVRETPRIELSAFLTEHDKTIIKLTDNGVGIPEDALDKIFIPFFSTRKNGNGIGLTLCKQIMILHQGSIQVQSVKDEGTSFVLQFN